MKPAWASTNAAQQAQLRRDSFDAAISRLRKNNSLPAPVTEVCKEINIANSTAYEPQWRPLFDRGKKEGVIIS